MWIRLGIVAAILIFGGLTWSKWWPPLNQWVQTTLARQRPAAAEGEAAHEHAGEAEGHAHEGHAHAHDEASSLELSEQARRNIGLTPEFVQSVKLQTFQRSITVPAVIVERPGRTRLEVAAPMTGVVTHVYAIASEAVAPGSLLFQVRLTHEDLVQAQTEFLKTLGELDVEKKEIARLEDVAITGAVAGKTLLERKYSRDKLEAMLKAQQEALRLHGLSEGQVEQIAAERRLLRDLKIVAPEPDVQASDELRLTGTTVQSTVFSPRPVEQGGTRDPYVIQELKVHKGQAVAAGETLCVLADYSRLYIEGLSFERDAVDVMEAQRRGWTVSATFEEAQQTSIVVPDLRIAFLSNEVDAESRTLHFYVDLPNERVRDDLDAEGHRFIAYRYRPGQRLQLRVPVEEWPEQIVLPVAAVAQEGAESFVFHQNGGHFDRAPVHVQYRDHQFVVIANDGSLFPGDVVALRGAHQMLMALKNKAGGGVDPHAGHNH